MRPRGGPQSPEEALTDKSRQGPSTFRKEASKALDWLREGASGKGKCPFGAGAGEHCASCLRLALPSRPLGGRGGQSEQGRQGEGPDEPGPELATLFTLRQTLGESWRVSVTPGHNVPAHAVFNAWRCPERAK